MEWWLEMEGTLKCRGSRNGVKLRKVRQLWAREVRTPKKVWNLPFRGGDHVRLLEAEIEVHDGYDLYTVPTLNVCLPEVSVFLKCLSS